MLTKENNVIRIFRYTPFPWLSQQYKSFILER